MNHTAIMCVDDRTKEDPTNSARLRRIPSALDPRDRVVAARSPSKRYDQEFLMDVRTLVFHVG